MGLLPLAKKSRLYAVVALTPLLLPVPQTRQSASPEAARSFSPDEGRFFRAFVVAAVERTHHVVRYDPAYVRIPYPGGDVPSSTGVCTDEVIRAYRAVGVDLQKEVHQDMLAHPDAYPRRWPTLHRKDGGTDTNIDHRRVANLMVFFSRQGKSLPDSLDPRDYLPGDLVAWSLGGPITHIGIVVNQKSPDSGRWLIVHNIGQGPKMEDVLFAWKIIGHYRYWR